MTKKGIKEFLEKSRKTVEENDIIFKESVENARKISESLKRLF